MSKQSFAELVKSFLKAAGYSQKILANELGMNSSVLSHKINGTSHFILTYPEIRNIVQTLAKLEAITRKQEAEELLELMGCPGFSSEEWKSSPLKNLEETVPANIQAGNNFKRSNIPGNDNSSTALKALQTNLPIQITSFIGRERAIEQTIHLLSTTHLLTLAGAGGVGKTRLALQVGAALLDSFKDGVWLVELAPLSEPSLVVQEVALTLELRAESGQALSLTLVDYFKARQALLILDNCEHLMEPCAALIIDLLRHCPDLRILATSRETFEITGETTYRVPSLSLPELNGETPQPGVTPDELTQFEAVELFVARAAAVQPGFSISTHNALTIAQICYRLDGIPLAIELAAARVNYLSVGQIMQHLDDRFRLLKGGSRVALPRQQTLRALIDWSHSLLSQPEQTVFRRLAVFAGGWSMEAAEKICAGEGVEEYEILDYLIQLVKKSLVLAEEVLIGKRKEVRYRMLETIRQYSLEKLKLAGEENWVQLKHLNYFLELAEEAEEKLMGAEQIEWSNLLEQEQDNVRTAMAWTITNRMEEPALRLAGSMQNFWGLRGYSLEGRKWLEASLNLCGSNSAFYRLRAKALCEVGFLAVWMWDFEAATNFSQESLAIYESLSDVRGCAHARGNLWRVAFFQGDFNKALPLAQENLTVLQQIGDKWWSTAVFGMIGIIKQKMGNMQGVRECFEECLRLSNGSADKEFSNPHLTALYTQMLGSLALDNQDLEQAARLLEESLKLDWEIGNTLDVGIALGQLSVVEMFQGNYEHARVLNEESMTLFKKIGNKSDLIIALWRFGILLLLMENYSYAAKLFKECLVLSQEYIYIPDKQAGMATCLEGLAYLAWHKGKVEKAIQLTETAQTLRHRINLPLLPLEHMMKDRFIRVVKEQFVDSQTHYLSTPAYSQGAELSLEKAIDLALQEDMESDL